MFVQKGTENKSTGRILIGYVAAQFQIRFSTAESHSTLFHSVLVRLQTGLMAICSANPHNFSLTWVGVDLTYQSNLFHKDSDGFMSGGFWFQTFKILEGTKRTSGAQSATWGRWVRLVCDSELTSEASFSKDPTLATSRKAFYWINCSEFNDYHR